LELRPRPGIVGLVRAPLQSDVLKIFAYVVASLLLGAALAPLFYQLGKGLAEVFGSKEGNGLIKYVSSAADRADFPRFFDRALLFSALLLLLPLTSWLRLGRPPGCYRDTPWSLRLPDHLVLTNAGQPLRRNPQGWWHFGTGFAISAGLLLLSGWLLLQAGCFMWKDAAASTRGVPNKFMMEIDLARAIGRVLPGAVIVALIEEVLFRGLLLGIFLRAMRTAPALALLSFLFAFVHFLQPLPSARVPDPEAMDAGFVLLGQIFARFGDPMSVISRFLILAVVGVVLGYARYRTASLWLPLGLHLGWVVGMKIFKAATWPVLGLPEAVRWLVGMSLLEGLLPLSVVVVTGLLVHAMTRPRPVLADYRS
jgi:membrane protease YdiL (CAAX protease family)